MKIRNWHFPGPSRTIGEIAEQAADANGLRSPMELLKTMLANGYRPGGSD